MGSELDSEPWWSDSEDLSRAIAYGVLAALDRSPESFHLNSLSSSSPISSATSSPSLSALPVADEGGLPAAVRPRRGWSLTRAGDRTRQEDRNNESVLKEYFYLIKEQSECNYLHCQDLMLS